MSLFSEALINCKIIEQEEIKDGYGGFKGNFKEVGDVECAIVLTSSIQTMRADSLQTEEKYTIITSREVFLKYNTIIKRNDGKCFRITSDGLDNKTPLSAHLNMRAYTAEDYSIE